MCSNLPELKTPPFQPISSVPTIRQNSAKKLAVSTFTLRWRERDISLRFRWIPVTSKSHVSMRFTCCRCPYLNLSEISLSLSESGHMQFTCHRCLYLNLSEMSLSLSESGHMQFTCRRCPYLNLSEISLSLSKALRIHS